METFSALLALCGTVTQSFGVYFDLRLNKRLCKQSWTGDFRRIRPHYDVTVMRIWVISLELGYRSISEVTPNMLEIYSLSLIPGKSTVKPLI